jgi:hypothetical protein
MTESPVHLYYWSVEFKDGYSLSQFDRQGNEISVRDFTPNKYLNEDRTIKQNANVFENMEKIHGRVTKVGWYPFTAEFGATCMMKQPNLRVGVHKELSPIERSVDETFYSTYFLKNVSIKYGLTATAQEIPLEQYQSAVHIGLFPREGFNQDPEVITCNVRLT